MIVDFSYNVNNESYGESNLDSNINSLLQITRKGTMRECGGNRVFAKWKTKKFTGLDYNT